MNNKKGFAAFILVVSVSAMMLAYLFISSIETGHFFDQVIKKEDRLISYYAAYSCIDKAVLILSHDYFFRTLKEIKIPELNCSIDFVFISHNFLTITVHGDYKGIKVYKTARGILYNDHIDIWPVQ